MFWFMAIVAPGLSGSTELALMWISMAGRTTRGRSREPSYPCFFIFDVTSGAGHGPVGAVQRKFLVLRQSKFPHLEMILVTFHTVGVSTHKLIPVGVIVTNRTP